VITSPGHQHRRRRSRPGLLWRLLVAFCHPWSRYLAGARAVHHRSARRFLRAFLCGVRSAL